MATNFTEIASESVDAPAAVECLAALELSGDAAPFFRDGMKQLGMGEPGKAIAMFSRALESAPDFTEAHIGLGLAQALTNSIYPALDRLEHAAKLGPDNFAAHFTLAQLNFKLRIPQKGYAAAERALQCVRSIEQRKMLTRLLKEERARERNGISRPWFNKPFSVPIFFLAGSGLAAALLAAILHVR
jgi:tetratricopeptide (TPR) repeat protein